MKKFFMFFFLILFSYFLWALDLSTDQIVNLFLQNTPDKVKKACEMYGRCDCFSYEQIKLEVEHRENSYVFQYLVFNLPGNSSDYILLYWGTVPVEGWWKLLMTSDKGQTFSVVCQNSKPFYRGYFSKLWLSDLTGDGIPELIYQGEAYGGSNFPTVGLNIWKWDGNCFNHIDFVDPINPPDEDFLNGAGSNTYIKFYDIDGDGVAEVIQGPYLDKIVEENGDVTWEEFPHTSIIYKFDGSKFVKFMEFDGSDPCGFYVPSLGAFHPSTIPFSELSNPGNGKISIFISDPAGNLTADDFAQNSFECNGVSLTFKKIWKNNKQPEENSANFEFVGVPVKQFVRKSQGEWQTNPSDPFILSPDQKMEYHFCGKYVELETNKALIFPQLKEKSEKFFSENPNKTEYFATIPIRAKFKNNKISQTSALICIKKTGNIAQDKKPQNVDTSKKGETKQTEKK